MVTARSERKWHAGRMLFALARHFDWWQNQLITEFEIDGLREDLVVVSRSKYATVIEIKISRGDWLKDRHKNRSFRQVSRFFYAVPLPLYEQGVPSHVPDSAGIIVVRNGGLLAGYDRVREVRAARRMKAEKLTAEQLASIERAFYYRFWRQHMELERLRLIDRPAMAKAAA